MNLRVVRTAKTRVSSLQSFKPDKPTSDPDEPEVSKEEVREQEAGVGDMFQEIFGEQGREVKPEEMNASVSKPHVRRDDEPEDIVEQPESAKPQYSGQMVQEGVNSSQADQVESADLDDLISQVIDVPPEDNTKPSDQVRPTSTPSKDDANDGADFGEGLSLIRGDDYEPPAVDKQDRDEARDRKPEPSDGSSSRYALYGTSERKPLSGGTSSITTTTTTTFSYSSRFVPTIPDSFYKGIQSRLEDLIFKFECLDNEYAALQKISHNVYVETLEVKKMFAPEN